MNAHTRASEPTARRPSARPFPLLSPQAAESVAAKGDAITRRFLLNSQPSRPGIKRRARRIHRPRSRAFALALVEHNDLEALCGSVEALVDDAERFGGLKAAWLAPYQVHVSKTVTMLCVDFAARDPAHDCTAIATTVQFVAREA